VLKVLQGCKSVAALARALSFKHGAMTYLLHGMADEAKYSTFSVPKRSGGMREISAPCKQLKQLQRNLADILQGCLDEIHETQGRPDGNLRCRPDTISHGFRRRRSIATNARLHRQKRFVFNVDLENFFGSFNFGRVRGFFIADRHFRLDPAVATAIAQIACFKNGLPQGSPCSPVISNLIGHVMDIHLVSLARTAGVTYTRYADDLTFSTNRPEFPKQIAVFCAGKYPKWEAGSSLKHITAHSGFALNEQKTRMQYCDERQMVTGLVVNVKTSAPIEYRRQVRQLVHEYTSKGKFFTTIEIVKDGQVVVQQNEGKPAALRGMQEFVIYASRRGRIASYDIPLNTEEKRYRSFVYFDNFYAPRQPIVLCEGKTDLVYLAQATRSLASEFPNLAEFSTDGKVHLKFRRHRFPIEGKKGGDRPRRGMLTARVLDLRGGAPQILNFLKNCKKLYPGFKAPLGLHPVVVVLDDDQGSSGIKSYIKNVLEEDVDWSHGFVRFFANIYVVLTPTKDGLKSSCMEDLFQKDALNIQVHGRTFNPVEDADTKTTYGKATFAYEVVAKQAKAMDFSEFRPLLKRIEGAVDGYRAFRNS
jgi:hypothetical protein